MNVDRNAMERDFENAQKESSFIRKYGPNINMLSIKSSENAKEFTDNLFRFCPPAPDWNKPYIEAFIHYRVGGLDENLAFCSERPVNLQTGAPFQRVCPLCQLQRTYKQSGNKQSKQFAESLEPRKSYIWQGIKLDTDEDILRGVGQIFCSKAVFTGLMAIFMDNRYSKNSILSFTDVESGRPINVKRKGTGWKVPNKTEYAILPLDLETLPPEIAQIIANPPAWSDLIIYYSEQDLMEMLQQKIVTFETAKHIIPFQSPLLNKTSQQASTQQPETQTQFYNHGTKYPANNPTSQYPQPQPQQQPVTRKANPAPQGQGNFNPYIPLVGRDAQE